MTKRRIAALVYICAVLLWGGAWAFYLRSSESSDLEIVSAVVIGSLGLTTMTYPLGVLAVLFGRIAAGIGVDSLDTWFAFVTLLSALAGYWQWFHLFPRLFSSVARRRQLMRDSTETEHRRGLLDRVIGMKRSRAVLLYVLIALIVGHGPAVLNRLPYFVHLWLLDFGFYSYTTDIRDLVSFGLIAVALLTFPAGALLYAAVAVPLVLLGLAALDEVLFLVTPLAALLGALQWFWLLPKLYRPKPKAVADVF